MSQFWFLLLALVLPAGVLILQQWSLGDQLSRLAVHQRDQRLRLALDAYMADILADYTEQNEIICREILQQVPSDETRRSASPRAFRKLNEVQNRLGRPAVLFTARRISDTDFNLRYFALYADGSLGTFTKNEVEPLHRAILTYLQSLAGDNRLYEKLLNSPVILSSEPSPLGIIHFGHVPLRGKQSKVPQAYVGFWETSDYFFLKFLRPYLERDTFKNHLQAQELHDLDLRISILDESGREIFANQPADENSQSVLEQPLGAYGSVFEPFVFRLEMRAIHGGSAASVLFRQNILLIALAALAVGIAALLLVRSAARDRRMARLHTDFVASISHELKTPVAVLLNAVESLENPKLTGRSDRQRVAGILGERARELARLLERLMEVCRVDADHLPVAPQIIDVRAYLQRALPKLAEQASLPQGAALSVSSSDSAMASLDTAALELILRNLLENVAKHAGDGASVTVSCTLDPRHTIIRVQDDGVGIARRDLRHIFRPFYRAEDSLQAARAGHGLGLALVKALTEAHGGRVRVSSEVGQGTTFELTLPRGVRP